MKNVYIVGICGTAMAPLAGILKSKGYNVIGSDSNAYPPMSDLLASLGIEVKRGYSRENLSGLIDRIDFAIIGNVVRRDNEEASLIIEKGIPYYSMPSFMERFILPDYKTLVVAGTHGKSTTTSMLASALDFMGVSPSFLIGAIPINFGLSFRLTDSKYFVIEGDEYDTAFFDKVPKFFHYRPYCAIITSIEFDHADIYPDFEVYKRQFVEFSNIVDKDGVLILKDDDVIAETITRSDIKKLFYGEKKGSFSRTLSFEYIDEYMVVKAEIEGKKCEYPLKVYGRQNVFNSLAVYTLLLSLGFNKERIEEALGQFKGVRRRMEFKGDYSGVGVIDDFAHHPTAVRITIEAVRDAYIRTSRYKRLISIFEPRSNTSRRNIFFKEYSEAFEGSDLVILSEPYRKADGIKDELDVKGVLQNLKKCGIKGFCGASKEELLDLIKTNIQEKDLLLFMSNGDFQGLVSDTINLLKGV